MPKIDGITIGGTTYDIYAQQLATPYSIDGVGFNGSADISHYAVCSTAAATAAKEATITGFNLTAGAQITIKFMFANTASNPTLNISGTGAKSIMTFDAIAADDGAWMAGEAISFIYDGTNYLMKRAAPATNTEQGTVMLDDEATENSNNVPKSGGVYAQLENVKIKAFSAFVTETPNADSVLTFADGADDIPVKDISVALEPIQDLNGYDKPWPAGAGKNIFEEIAADRKSNQRIAADGSIESITGWYYYATYEPITDGTWTVSFNKTSTGNYAFRVALYDENKNFIRNETPWTSTTATGTLSGQITVNVGEVFFRVSYPTGNKIMIEAGGTASPYEPYANVCPISGRTGLSVTRCGKNLFDPQILVSAGFTKQDNGEYWGSTSNNWSTRGKIKFKENTRYKVGFKGYNRTSTNTNTYLVIHYTDGTTSQSGYINSQTQVSRTLTTTSGKTIDYINRTYANSGAISFYDVYIIEDTSGVYVPYNGQTVTVDWTDEAGEVYGGTLDITTGVLTPKYRKQLLSAFSWSTEATDYGQCFVISAAISDKSGNFNYLCTSYKNNQNTRNTLNNLEIGSQNTTTAINRLVIRNDAYATAADFTASFSNDDYVVYELRASSYSTYQFTPQEVTTLLGFNTVYTLDGTISLTYRADTKMYIDNAIKNTKSIIAGIETSFVATTNYAQGDMFIVGDTLYKATAAIANGGTITVGTNCQATTVAEQLILLANS